MRITFVPHGYSAHPIGGLKLVYEYSNHLAARGHKVTVVHPQRLAIAGSRTVDRAYRWLRHSIRQTVDLASVPEPTWHAVDSRVMMLDVPEPSPHYVPDADAVVATFWVTAQYVLNYPQRKGRKFFVLQAFEQEWAGPKVSIDAVWKAPMGKIAVSKALHEYALALGIPKGDITYIPNGVDHDKYKVINPIANRGERIAMLYHPMPLKGSLDGIAALELVRRSHESLDAVLFGTPARPDELPEWISYVRMPSMEELVNDIYNGSSIYICPSWKEGFSLPPAEAMACGCAVVATDSGGVLDFAEHGVTALISSPRDPQGLAGNILRLLADDDLRVKLANAGHQRIQKFTWEQSAELLEGLLEERNGR